MKSIAIQVQKGGAGKTMLSVSLAGAFIAARRRVIILEVDQQGSASAWRRVRDLAEAGPEPQVLPIGAADLRRQLDRAAAQSFDLVIIDTPPHATSGAKLIAEAADLVLIPVKPDPFDLAATEATARIVAAAKVKRAFFVINQARMTSPRVAMTAEALASYGHPVCPIVLAHAEAYPNAAAQGLTVQEFAARSKAAAQIAELATWIMGEL